MNDNTEIASAAQRKGWKWNPYGVGFSKERKALRKTTIDLHCVASEREVFEFVKLPFLEPWERE